MAVISKRGQLQALLSLIALYREFGGKVDDYALLCEKMVNKIRDFSILSPIVMQMTVENPNKNFNISLMKVVLQKNMGIEKRCGDDC